MTPTPSQREQAIKSGTLISDLDFLTKRREFQEFTDRWRDAAANIAREILENDDLSDLERERLRQRRKGILEVLDSPEQDMKINRKIVDGIYPGGEG